MYFYIDQDLILDTEFFPNFGPEINYFSVAAAQGSGVKFDNIQITTDYDAVCDDLSCPSPPGPVKPRINLLLYIGVGVVAIVTTFGAWQYFKKKGMKN